MQHFLQSEPWQHFQQALGRAPLLDSGDGWSYTAYLEKGAGNTRLYTPYGPVIDSPEAFAEALVSLKKLANEHGATFLRIEPTYPLTPDFLRQNGFKPVTYQQLNPTHTLVIDLSKSENDILAQMSQNSRNLTRNYAKKGLTITQSQDPKDITILTSLLQGVAARNSITPHSDDYFKKQAEVLLPLGAAHLFYVSHQDQPIAAALVYDSPTTRYYAHAAADDAFRKLSAGTALVGQMILEAKSRGLSQFDLYGIAPPDQPSHPWSGFTKFKKSFGGDIVTYGGTWDLPLKPLAYRAYRSYQNLRRRLK